MPSAPFIARPFCAMSGKATPCPTHYPVILNDLNPERSEG